MILTRILPGIVGILACATISMAAEGVVLGKANEAAVRRYSKQYIAHPEGKEILKGILWVESKYGKYKKGKGSYGIAQIEIPTARYVAYKFGFKIPKTDKAIKEMLMRDDCMSIRLAAAYLGLLEKRFGSLDSIIVAYNLGPAKLSSIAKDGRKVTTAYLDKVMTVTRKNRMASKALASKAVNKASVSASVKSSLAKELMNEDLSGLGESEYLFLSHRVCPDNPVDRGAGYLSPAYTAFEPLSCTGPHALSVDIGPLQSSSG